jgi:FAD/FMN-containing dehydrogenase
MAQVGRTAIGTCRVVWRGEPGYEEARLGATWNAKKPDRFPQVIVTVASDNDVALAIDYASSEGLRVAVRSGGHSLCGSPIRDGGMLLDMSQLREISIDRASRTALVQPATTARQLANALGEHGLAFPVGHCGSVSLGGYLLSGGLGWNSGTWGPGCFSLRSLKMVTARGELIEVDDKQNTDLFWAARGAGPGYFGAATEFRLRLYDMPRVIRMSTYLYRVTDVEEVSRWMMQIVPALAPMVQMTAALTSPPPDKLAGRNEGGIRVMGVSFADTEQEAIRYLAPLDTCPALRRALRRRVGEPASFKLLFDQIDALLPEGHRYMSEALWSNEDLPTLLPLLAEHLARGPSSKSLVMGGTVAPRPRGTLLPNAAFSMVAKTLLLCYSIWEHEADDAANEEWFQGLVASVEPFVIGHYIAEAHLPAGPSRSTGSFAPSNWERLGMLRRRFDPEGLFHTYLGLGTEA